MILRNKYLFYCYVPDYTPFGYGRHILDFKPFPNYTKEYKHKRFEWNVECTIEALQLQKSCVKIQDFKTHSIRVVLQCNDSHASSYLNDKIISSFPIKSRYKIVVKPLCTLCAICRITLIKPSKTPECDTFIVNKSV